MDYSDIQGTISGLDSNTAGMQLAQQNPNIDPHMLLPQLDAFSKQQQASAMGSDAGMLQDPTRTMAQGPVNNSLIKGLSGAKDAIGIPPVAAAPTTHPFGFGQPKSVKPVIALPGGPTTAAPSFGALMGAKRYGY